MSAPNRLIHETSPYLRQHAHNPVDWFAWGDDARARAAQEDLPIFLSVGYSTCHWCHVMERESFEDPALAAVLNAAFVPVKVDREERPDLDEIYMTVTQLLTGHGGWPNSVWLTPDGRPWYAGTYFPPEDRGGRPGFRSILERLAEAWRTRRAEIEESADQITARLREVTSHALDAHASGRPGRAVVERALEELRARFDARHGGFGDAPKFPPHASLRLLLREVEAGRDAQGELRAMLETTLDAMRRGGIHDPVGGGFHRYATDANWRLPHFEKMLYDNAQLLEVFARAGQRFERPDFRAAAIGIFEWCERELLLEGGAYAAALDADTEGHEGKTYVWRVAEIEAALGPGDAALCVEAFDLDPAGNFRDEANGQRTGENVLHLVADRAALAARHGLSLEVLEERLAAACAQLRAVRDQRPQPARDDKVLVAWNGLALGALARAAPLLDDARLLERARAIASFIDRHCAVDGRLRAVWCAGRARHAATLDDYVFLADGLAALARATGDASLRTAARRWLDVALTHFWSAPAGGFHFVADDHEPLLVRTIDCLDHATPSGNGIAVRLLAELARELDAPAYLARAAQVLERFAGRMRSVPRATETLIEALVVFLDDEAEGAARAGDAPRASRVEGRTCDAETSDGPLTVRYYLERLQVTAGAELRLAAVLVLPAGCHLQAEPTLDLRGAEAIGLPEIRHDGEAGTTTLVQRLRSARTVGTAALEVAVTVTLCTEQHCEPPRTLTAALPILVAAADGTARHASVFAVPDEH